MDFTEQEKKVLNRIQSDIPLRHDPFHELSRELSINENDLLACISSLKEHGVIRNISGIFNADRVGYASCLVAFCVEGDVEKAATVINAHPGVSHNYLRDHLYNIWFTLAAESNEMLEKTVTVLAMRAQASDYLILRNEKMLKIGLHLPIGDDNHMRTTSSVQTTNETYQKNTIDSDVKKEAIRLLQLDLALDKNPFALHIEQNKSFIDVNTLLNTAREFKDTGIMRRFSAVLRHRKAGYIANAMTVWKPKTGFDLKRIAERFSVNQMVSHLYLRTVYPGRWDYPLFAMIHAKTDGELLGIVGRLAHETGIADHKVLRTLREFKKEKTIYFSAKFKEWEQQAGL